MPDWSSFADQSPELAAFAAERLAGRVAYLATTRADGGPRVHPVTPIIGGGRLFVFMEPSSPKGRDLQRDGRYALHCGVEGNDGGGGEVSLRGTALLVDDPELRAVAAQASSYPPRDRYVLFALGVDEVQGIRYEGDAVARRRWPG